MLLVVPNVNDTLGNGNTHYSWPTAAKFHHSKPTMILFFVISVKFYQWLINKDIMAVVKDKNKIVRRRFHAKCKISCERRGVVGEPTNQRARPHPVNGTKFIACGKLYNPVSSSRAVWHHGKCSYLWRAYDKCLFREVKRTQHRIMVLP
jgi:hypothetical protein